MNLFRLRRKAGEIYYRLRSVKPDPLAAAGRGRPIVVGFLRTPSGIGESARLCFAALTRLGLRPGYVDLSARFQPDSLLDGFVAGRDLDDSRGPLIIHANPPELPAVTAYLGRALMAGRLVIGYWSWEIETTPFSWHEGYRFVHDVWVPSRFCAEAIRKIVPCPVRVVFHPLAAPSAAADRARFGLPEDAFVVLAVADVRSSLARKNPLAALAAFRRARDQRRNWKFVLKLGGATGRAPGRESAVRELFEAVGGDPSVSLITDPLSPADMAALLASVDAVLSLHRAEGFGLVPAEALFAGKPVIATDWSGTCDFLRADDAALVPARLVPVVDPQGIYALGDARWAEPDIDAAAAFLRRLADDPDYARSLGGAAARAAVAFFGDTRYADSLGPRFHEHTAGPDQSFGRTRPIPPGSG